ncbi:hypothetical protein fHeYen901_39 [Yersinia phage fHe-Yen9-01]|uniref:Uncharacterized protein n=1 Tax=Yersinia phage fHe-Yen9-01 TaxID=1965363 RepID=A0A1V0DXD2_9CAUD|nr:hypothetical protein KNT60_gp038 [Yersinia phage fHe-Yen9-01]ARB05812.1 hypothetical protein fHeYen901_39 [Yersinia phage fHe-Yen9-01]
MDWAIINSVDKARRKKDLEFILERKELELARLSTSWAAHRFFLKIKLIEATIEIINKELAQLGE